MARMDSPSERRRLFAEKLGEMGVRFALVSNPRHIFWLTGVHTNLNPYYVLYKGPRSTSFLLLGSEGEESLFLGSSEVRSPWDTPGTRPDMAVSSRERFSDFDGDSSEYADYDLEVTMAAYGSEIAPKMARWVKDFIHPEAKADGMTLGIEDWHLASIYRDAALSALPTARLAGTSGMIMDLRKTKGRDELGNIRRATEAIDFALGIAKENLSPGKTEVDLFREMNYAAFEKFGVFGIISGDVVSGERTLQVAGMASNRKLQNGDTVILDLQTRHQNYWSDIARTFIMGGPSPAQRRAYETVAEAKDLAASKLTPGTPANEIVRSVNELLERKGYPRVPHHTGHALGLDDQERPWLIPGSGDLIQENQAFVIEPGIYTKETGGIRLEDCYFVTGSGLERISHFPLEP